MGREVTSAAYTLKHRPEGLQHYRPRSNCDWTYIELFESYLLRAYCEPHSGLSTMKNIKEHKIFFFISRDTLFAEVVII